MYSFSDPKYIIEQFELLEGTRVVDLGAGSGAYALAAAEAVGEDGMVYAVEVQKELLSHIKNTAKLQGLHNIETVWGDVEKLGGTKLRDFSADAIIASNILFQLEDKNTFISECARILKPKKRILVVDWSGSFGNMGPRQEDVVSKEAARALFEKHGFTFEKDVDAGEHHYGMVFRKAI